jgi:CcmD family protein
MKMLFNKKGLVLLTALLLQLSMLAQSGEPAVEMADSLYQSGKIYVVVSVITVVFIGIIVYLILLDRKIGKLEKELNKN